MINPVQQLLLPADLESTLFPPTSRYHSLGVLELELSDGRKAAYLRRRFLPAPGRLASFQEHIVSQGDRLDTLANQYLGDPELFWRICDANGAIRPEELIETPGRRIRISLPEGIEPPTANA